MKFNWTQFAIALGLFLLGYMTFNSPWFSSKPTAASATPAAVSVPVPSSATSSALSSAPSQAPAQK